MSQEHRFFLPLDADDGKANEVGCIVELSDADSHHVRNVLRLLPESNIVLVSRVTSEVFNATIVADKSRELRGEKRTVQAEITSVITERKAQLTTFTPDNLIRYAHLVVALPKSDLPEWITEKATELGATTISFFAGDRSVVKLKTSADTLKKQRRLEVVAEAASKQSKRSNIPKIVVIESLETALHSLPEKCSLFQCSLDADAVMLKKMQPTELANFALIIGPEGDFSNAENALLQKSGAQKISLGTRTLRVETAAICALAQTALLWQTEA